MFPPETYSARRAALASRFEGGLLLFPGNGESPMNYADNCYPFRQDSTFLYCFGLDQPGPTEGTCTTCRLAGRTRRGGSPTRRGRA